MLRPQTDLDPSFRGKKKSYAGAKKSARRETRPAERQLERGRSSCHLQQAGKEEGIRRKIGGLCAAGEIMGLGNVPEPIKVPCKENREGRRKEPVCFSTKKQQSNESWTSSLRRFRAEGTTKGYIESPDEGRELVPRLSRGRSPIVQERPQGLYKTETCQNLETSAVGTRKT